MGAVRNCRLCNSNHLQKFLDLGFTPPADAFLRREGMNEAETWYPLNVRACAQCGYAQLGYVVPPEILYRHDYPYESSITRAGHEHWREFAKTVHQRFVLSETDLVVDIGSNVGVLLSEFRSCGARILGVDPASNIVRLAEKRGIPTLCEFFSAHVAQQILRSHGPASVITATNVFAHVDDVADLLEAISVLLKDDGVFIFEAPHFMHLLNKLEYDTIYHEHLSYVSIKPLVSFFARLGYEIFDIEQRDIHGGSIRVYVTKSGVREIQPIVSQLVELEELEGNFNIERLREFGATVAQHRSELCGLIHQLRYEGKRIAAVSAPAKGMTLLNYCGFGRGVLEYCTEKSELKIDRYTPGTHLYVYPDSHLLEDMPDYALLLAWNFAEEIMNNLSEYRSRGGKFIIPIPKPQIVG